MRLDKRRREDRSADRRHRGRAAIVFVAIIATVLFGCATESNQSGAPSGSASPVDSPGLGTGPAPSRDPAPVDCRKRIEAANLVEPETLDSIAACRFTVEGFHAARDVLAAGGSDDVIWAAIWVYAPGAWDPAPLRPILERDDPTLRVLAAAGLVALGDETGFDVLAAQTTNRDHLSGSEPPIPIREFVVGTLYRYVGAEGAPGRWTTYEEYLTVDKRWTDWLKANDWKLTFDAETGQWIVP